MINAIINSISKGIGGRIRIAAIFAIIYSLFIAVFIGWRSDHTFFVSVMLFALVIHRYSFKVVMALSAFIIFWIVYDSMRIFPNYKLNPVHVFEPYNIELAMFGVWDGDQKVILSEWFASRTTSFLTLFSGVSYLLWVPGPIAYALFLMKDHVPELVDFTYAFLLTNFVGFVIYYAYPAAPPWYYMHYGAATDFTIPGSAALLAEFDKIVGVEIFGNIYNKNANVFAAIPSLHSAYPIVGLFYSIKYKHRNFIIFFSVLTFGIWFGAVYSQHHYVIDLLLGFLCAVCGYYLISGLNRTSMYKAFASNLGTQIALK